MSGKIIGFLGVVCVILILMLSYTTNRINTLKGEKNALKTDLLKKEQTIKEMEKINELYQKAEAENERFRETLNSDTTDNLNVVPANYILNQLHKD